VLILVRHGQTELNAAGRLQGRSDVPLTELGRVQAQAAANAVGVKAVGVTAGGERPARVVTSPLLRAQQTAAAFGLEVSVDPRWTELDYGEFEGARLADVPSTALDVWRRDATYRPPGGESLAEVGARVREACAELAPIAAVQDVIVVSHVSPIKAAVAWALGVGDEAAWRMFLDVAAICRIAVSDRGPSLVTFNERAHLA
jgi:broad specificity phosphatase PhoE